MKRTFYVKIIGGNYDENTIYTIVFSIFFIYTIKDTEDKLFL